MERERKITLFRISNGFTTVKFVLNDSRGQNIFSFLSQKSVHFANFPSVGESLFMTSFNRHVISNYHVGTLYLSRLVEPHPSWPQRYSSSLEISSFESDVVLKIDSVTTGEYLYGVTRLSAVYVRKLVGKWVHRGTVSST